MPHFKIVLRGPVNVFCRVLRSETEPSDLSNEGKSKLSENWAGYIAYWSLFRATSSHIHEVISQKLEWASANAIPRLKAHDINFKYNILPWKILSPHLPTYFDIIVSLVRTYLLNCHTSI